MTRLPVPGGDDGDWGDVLNAYLKVSLAPDGTLNPDTVGSSQIINNAITSAQLDSSIQNVLDNAVQLGGDLGGTPSSPTVLSTSGLRSATTNVAVNIAPAPAAGQVLTATSTTAAQWSTPAAGAGNATNSNPGVIQLAGDLGGSYNSPIVAQINGVGVSAMPAPGQTLIATSPTAASWSSLSYFDVAAYGAVGDAVTVADGAVSSGSSTFTSASLLPFSGTRTINIAGAAASGNGLTTTLTCTVSGTGTLGTTASTTVSSANAAWGTDDTAAIQATINAAGAMAGGSGVATIVSGHPGHRYLVTFSGPAVNFTVFPSVHLALQVKPNVTLEGLNIVCPDFTGVAQAVIGDDAIGMAGWKVRNCVLHGLAPNGLNTEYAHWAILFGNSSNITIERNMISLFRQSAIVGLAQNSGTPSFIRILENTITLCQGGAIKPDGGVADLWIQRNVITDNLGIVSGSGSGAEQIYINSTSGNNQRIHINDNYLSNWGACVIFGSASYFNVSGNWMLPPPGGVCVGSYAGGQGVSNGSVAHNVLRPIGGANAAVKWGNTASAVSIDANIMDASLYSVLYDEIQPTTQCSVTNNVSGGLMRIIFNAGTLVPSSRGNVGNPVAIQPLPTTPGLPASGTAQQNTQGCDMTVCIAGGTVTAVQIGTYAAGFNILTWVNTGLTSGTFQLSPGDEIKLTYSVAPTWVWVPRF